MESSFMGSKRLTPTIVGKMALKRLLLLLLLLSVAVVPMGAVAVAAAAAKKENQKGIPVLD